MHLRFGNEDLPELKSVCVCGLGNSKPLLLTLLTEGSLLRLYIGHIGMLYIVSLKAVSGSPGRSTCKPARKHDVHALRRDCPNKAS